MYSLDGESRAPAFPLGASRTLAASFLLEISRVTIKWVGRLDWWSLEVEAGWLSSKPHLLFCSHPFTKRNWAKITPPTFAVSPSGPGDRGALMCGCALDLSTGNFFLTTAMLRDHHILYSSPPCNAKAKGFWYIFRVLQSLPQSLLDFHSSQILHPLEGTSLLSSKWLAKHVYTFPQQRQRHRKTQRQRDSDRERDRDYGRERQRKGETQRWGQATIILPFVSKDLLSLNSS